jgi:hypothetical protein
VLRTVVGALSAPNAPLGANARVVVGAPKGSLGALDAPNTPFGVNIRTLIGGPQCPIGGTQRPQWDIGGKKLEVEGAAGDDDG